jgi:hypothetical protein
MPAKDWFEFAGQKPLDARDFSMTQWALCKNFCKGLAVGRRSETANSSKTLRFFANTLIQKVHPAKFFASAHHFFGSAPQYLGSVRRFLSPAQHFLASVQHFLSPAPQYLASVQRFLGSAPQYFAAAHGWIRAALRIAGSAA